MRLSYASEGETDQVLVLCQGRHRVELSIYPCEPLWLLVGLSGQEGRPANLSKCQGPFQCRAEGVAARKAITAALQSKGYKNFKRTSCWDLQAMALARLVSRERNDAIVDTRFNPETDIY